MSAKASREPKKKPHREMLLDTVAFHLRTQLGYTPLQTSAAMKAAEITYDLMAETTRQLIASERRKARAARADQR